MDKNELQTENMDSVENLKKKKKKKSILSRKRTRRWIARSVLVLLSLSFIFISLYWIPANLNYRVSESFTVSSADETGLNLVVLLPTTGTYQTLSELQVDWPGSWQAERVGRANLVRLEGAIKAGETLTATITYDVHLVMGEAIWTGEPVLSENLLPQEGIPSDSPEVIAQAEGLMVENDALATAGQIYDAVASQTGLTDSLERANVLAALNRAAQIPTRVVMGWVLPDSVPFFRQQIANDTGLHSWNEVFLQDVWQLEDASCCRPFPRQRLLGWSDGRHLVLDMKGDLEAVAQSLAEEAGLDGWQPAPSSSPAFVIWPTDGAETLEVVPAMTAKKTWDGRWAMAIAVVVILTVLEGMMETDYFTKRSKRKAFVD